MQVFLRLIAIISFIVAIVWVIQARAFEPEPILAFLGGLTSLALSFVGEKKEDKETLDERNRRLMLDHVENSWIKGILNASLHDEVLIELGMKEEHGAIYPWRIKKESTNETLPPGKSMLEIFLEIGRGRSLLILGAPGSGKTTMLLELTRQLIGRARDHATEPIPVVFNLASWTEKQNLADWLAEQLNLVYSVPRKIAPSWVQGSKMLLLLDGFDEVREESRVKCVEALNHFRNEHGLISLVVCSRMEEYAAIKTKLAFEGAITIQSLTSEQISTYIDRFGNNLASLRLLLKEDNALQELAETPLMLSIMTLAYKDVKTEELLVSPQIEDQRKNLFNTYIDRMFERSTRSANAPYSAPFSKPETLHYLSWLARTMVRHNIITYQIESMQRSWIVEQPQLRLYRLNLGLLGGLFCGLVFGLMGGLIGGLVFGLLSGLLFGLAFGLSGRNLDKISMVDKLTWSWKPARRELVLWLSIGLSAGLLFGLLFGLSSEEVEETTYPAQRLKQSLISGLLTTLIVGMFAGLSFALLVGLIGGLSFELVVGLVFGLVLGLVFGLLGTFGGSRGGYWSLFQHYSLRLVLAWHHLLPWHLIAFLEHAVSLIFLRRVGGSYIFVHRLLMEHFAEMEV
jgi:hypothetical protein